jgi:N utilization substance protein A
MNPSEILRIVDAIHRDKNIDKEIVFQAIESALVSASRKNYGDDAQIEIHIDRQDGSIQGTCDGIELDPEETVGRIGAQTAKQVIIQKIREAERDALFEEYDELVGQMVGGVVQRNEGRATTVSLGNVEAILPRGEQIPGETHHANERVRATVFEVRKEGSRVKVVLSRTRPQLVQRLFEQEIPEIADGVIEVRAMAREPGYRSKVAVSSADQRVDCVGACVGVRGNRIKNIVDELAGERIDIVRWNDDMKVLIPNALQPAEVDDVILCKMMGRAIVLVREDQLSLAIGRRGQNVRLASKLCGWDIEIMTQEELQEQIESAVVGFSSLEGVTDELAERLVGEGFLSYDDLSVIEPSDLIEMGGLTEEIADVIVEQAESRAEEAEQAAAAERRRIKEQERIEKATAEAETLERKKQAKLEAAAGDANSDGNVVPSPTPPVSDADIGDPDASDPDASDADSSDTDSSDTENGNSDSDQADVAESESSDTLDDPAERHL